MKLINVIKPTHVCNLSCSYCYNDDERRPFMDTETLEKVIEQTFSLSRFIGGYKSVEFIWHGGEPLLAPLSYYENIAVLQEKYAAQTLYSNIIQTNGTLIKKEHLNLFKKHGFQVSLSIDGIKESHDANRVFRNGKGSFSRILETINKLRTNGFKIGCVLVLNTKNIKKIKESYAFFREHKVGLNIIPLMKGGSANNVFNELALTQEEYVEAWTSLYDDWLSASNEDYVDVSCFLHTTRSVISGSCSSCIGMSQCGIANLSTDPLGNIYPCASLTGNKNVCYGNINEKSLIDLFYSDTAVKWRQRSSSVNCSKCKWFHLCHGGCPSRSYHYYNGEYNIPDHYCQSIKMIYDHVESQILRFGIKPGEIKPNHLTDGFINVDDLMLRR